MTRGKRNWKTENITSEWKVLNISLLIDISRALSDRTQAQGVGLIWVSTRSKQRRGSQMKYNFKTRRSKYIRHRLFSCFSHLHIFKHHAFVRECRSEDLLHDEVRKTHMNHWLLTDHFFTELTDNYDHGIWKSPVAGPHDPVSHGHCNAVTQ